MPVEASRIETKPNAGLEDELADVERRALRQGFPQPPLDGVSVGRLEGHIVERPHVSAEEHAAATGERDPHVRRGGDLAWHRSGKLGSLDPLLIDRVHLA